VVERRITFSGGFWVYRGGNEVGGVLRVGGLRFGCNGGVWGSSRMRFGPNRGDKGRRYSLRVASARGGTIGITWVADPVASSFLGVLG